METKRVAHTTYETVYVCSDGKEFKDARSAQAHEDELIPPRVIDERYIKLETLEDYGTSSVYKITSEEDLEYLQAKVWDHNGNYEYNGPGWYIALWNDGGDYHDWYVIKKIDDYEIMLREDLETIKYLTNPQIMLL